jgi:hypothetical protein
MHCWDKWDKSNEVRRVGEGDIKQEADKPSSRVNIARVGSKNRVCLPPRLVDHLGVKVGDNMIWILQEDDKGHHFSYMNVVKPEHFEDENTEIVAVSDTFKK